MFFAVCLFFVFVFFFVGRAPKVMIFYGRLDRRLIFMFFSIFLCYNVCVCVCFVLFCFFFLAFSNFELSLSWKKKEITTGIKPDIFYFASDNH